MNVGAILVDGANMSRALTARSGGGTERIDYGRLVSSLNTIFSTRFLFRNYYTTHQSGESLARRQKFYDHLRSTGWTVFDMPARFVTNRDHPDGIWIDKGVDLAIGLDAYKLALSGQVSRLAVATHDTDFVQLFKRIPPSVKAAVIGWKEWLSKEFVGWADPVYLDHIGVVRKFMGI